MDGLTIRTATLDDVVEMHRIENICFPPDEAADLEGVRYRIANASKYFSILENGSSICGFINGTCVADTVIHHDSMSTHNPDGATLVIHSVSIVPEMRRQKLGTGFLKRYMDNIINNKDYTNITRVLLLTHAYLLPFYSEVLAMWFY